MSASEPPPEGAGIPNETTIEASGLHQSFLQERDRLLRFFRARGAGDAAEDLLQDLWLKLTAAPAGPIGNASAYLFKSANFLMIDRYRSHRQAKLREQDWVDASSGLSIGVSDQPSAERELLAQDELDKVNQALNALGGRAAAIFRRHRIDAVPQRQIAEEFSVSLSTVESDLRQAYRAILEKKGQWDEG